jgi:heme/copper-type cytochrome/quinol oxidase subunit 2
LIEPRKLLAVVFLVACEPEAAPASDVAVPTIERKIAVASNAPIPDDPTVLRVDIVGSRAGWVARYPQLNATLTNAGDPERIALLLPNDRTLKITVSSSDVPHSLYIPALRVKTDVVPGREHALLLATQEPGRYDMRCLQHESERAKLEIVDSDAFGRALTRAGAQPTAK